MSFSIKYRSFASKAKTEFDDIPCEASGLSVLAVKQFLLNTNKFSKTCDFDFELKEDVTNKLFDDETAMVHPGTYIVAKRVLGSLMARLASGAGAAESNNNSSSNNSNNSNNSSSSSSAVESISSEPLSTIEVPQSVSQPTAPTATNNSKLLELEQLRSTVITSASSTDGGLAAKLAASSNLNNIFVVDSNFICRKCNGKGHHPKVCPNRNQQDMGASGYMTNIDPATGQPRKPSRGPKDLIKQVSSLEEIDMTTLKEEGSTLIQNSDGTYFVHKCNTKALNAMSDAFQVGQSATLNIEEITANAPARMICPINKSLLKHAVTLPCCGKTVNEEAVVTDKEFTVFFTCPLCSQVDVYVEKLLVDDKTRMDAVQFERTYFKDKDGTAENADSSTAASGATAVKPPPPPPPKNDIPNPMANIPLMNMGMTMPAIMSNMMSGLQPPTGVNPMAAMMAQFMPFQKPSDIPTSQLSHPISDEEFNKIKQEQITHKGKIEFQKLRKLEMQQGGGNFGFGDRDRFREGAGRFQGGRNDSSYYGTGRDGNRDGGRDTGKGGDNRPRDRSSERRDKIRDRSRDRDSNSNRNTAFKRDSRDRRDGVRRDDDRNRDRDRRDRSMSRSPDRDKRRQENISRGDRDRDRDSSRSDRDRDRRDNNKGVKDRSKSRSPERDRKRSDTDTRGDRDRDRGRDRVRDRSRDRSRDRDRDRDRDRERDRDRRPRSRSRSPDREKRRFESSASKVDRDRDKDRRDSSKGDKDRSKSRSPERDRKRPDTDTRGDRDRDRDRDKEKDAKDDKGKDRNDSNKNKRPLPNDNKSDNTGSSNSGNNSNQSNTNSSSSSSSSSKKGRFGDEKADAAATAQAHGGNNGSHQRASNKSHNGNNNGNGGGNKGGNNSRNNNPDSKLPSGRVVTYSK